MSKTTYDAIAKFYSEFDEENRLSSRCGRLEFLTTLRYIEMYLKPGMRVLEIGAGTGEYSLYLARKGYIVDAVELVPRNIEVFEKRVTSNDAIRIFEGNAMNLSFLSSEEYDLTLLIGPMYHLFEEVDKRAALSEAVRVTKKKGLLFVAYCMNDAVIIRHGFVKGDVLLDVNPEEGFANFKSKSKKPNVIELYTKEEIDELILGFPLNRLHYVGTDMLGIYMRNTIDQMSQEMFSLFLEYHLAICERKDMVGITGHSLDILRKE